MKRILLMLIVVFVIVACSKDKFQTRPMITIAGYNSKIINTNQQLQINLNYTDKEGDIGGGGYFIYRIRLNQKPLSAVDNIQADTIISTIPAMPNESKGQLTVSLDYSYLLQSTTESDTMIFKIAITDLAGNKSDTLTTDKIVALKN